MIWMRHKVQIVACMPGAAPEAVLTKYLALALRVMGPRGVFDAKLSQRWGVPVVCTPEFSAWWAARSDQPSGFFMEVTA